ncbi:hypothetical protein ACP70R_038729 [Stipagrostis hirtigluma subsp. patula]
MDPEAAEADALLLALHDEAEPLAGAVDYRGRDVSRKRHGRWLSANFIIGTEVAERFAFYGVSSNLISYLTGPLGESTAAAAAAVNAWAGASQMLPLLGACVADSWLGRYRTILLASALYILGLGMVTISAVLPPDHAMQVCADVDGAARCRPSGSHALAFYVSIYMVAFAQGCHKPCVQAFGADQFDRSDAEESAARSSFFNWLRFWMSWGDTVAVVVLSYVQDNVGWGLGFGIPWVVVCFSMAIFLLGTRTYRMYPPEKDNPFARIGSTFLAMSKNWMLCFLPGDQKPAKTIAGCEEMAVHVEEAKGILRLFPIWVTSLIYAIVFAQVSTLFTKQASTLDRSLGKVLDVPAAALQSFGGVTIIALIPVYDRAIVPLARRLTRLPSGITMLQRIGAGIAVAVMTMAAAAMVEGKRLAVAREHGVADDPGATVPMSLWWIVPQYVLIGVADVLTIVGLQEFFYDQVPDSLRSLGLALYLSILGIGSFLSGLLVSVIDGMTRRGGGEGWFSDNLNRAHLDYFYWLLAALSAAELIAFLHYAGKYVYKKKDKEAAVY